MYVCRIVLCQTLSGSGKVFPSNQVHQFPNVVLVTDYMPVIPCQLCASLDYSSCHYHKIVVLRFCAHMLLKIKHIIES
jgi:hypothetical protein